MANHLFDALFAPHAGKDTAFLISADGARISYSEFMRSVAQFSNALRAFDVSPGARVAVQVEKSPQALALYAACVSVGAVFLPLNTAYTPAEVSYFAGDAEPALLVCDPASAQVLEPIVVRYKARIATLAADGSGTLNDAASAQPADPHVIPRGPRDAAAILYTSGTTGRAKGAVLSHDNLLSNALTLRDLWRFTEGDRLLHALPVFHVHGLFVATNVVLAAGASMIFLPKFDAQEVVQIMPQASAMMGVPTFYTRLLAREDFTESVARSIRVFISGSAPLLPSTFQQFQERTGQRILERYGMTETGMITSNPYEGERRGGSVGFPLPGVSVRIADGTGVVAQGESGVIEVKGPNVFSGYWRRPDLQESEFRTDGYFITGDVGYIDGDGYVTIAGRAKDLVITGGLNVYPKEIETIIDGIEGVVESAVFGLPHSDFGEAVAAAVVVRKDANVTAATIKSALAGQLASFKQPKFITLLNDLPRNTMGKVQKNVLRDIYKETFATRAQS